MPFLAFTTRDDVSATADRITGKIKDQKVAVQQNAAEARRLDAVGQQIARRQESAQDRYNRLLKDTQGALQRGSVSQATYNKEVASLNKELQTSTGRFKSFKDHVKDPSPVTQIAKMALAYVGVQQALQLITSELRAQQELRDKAAGVQMEVGAARNEMRRALFGKSTALQDRVLARNRRIAEETGVLEGVIQLARKEATTTAGGNLKESLFATQAAAQLYKDAPDKIATAAKALVNVVDATKSLDAAYNVGLLGSLAARSGSGFEDTLANAPDNMARMAGLGVGPAQSAALIAAFQNVGGDSTSLLAMAKKMSDKTFLDSLTKDVDFTLRGDARKLAGAKSMDEQLALLQSNPALAAAFIRKAGIRAKSLGAARSLLGGGDVASDYKRFLAEFSDEAALRKKGEEIFGQLSRDDTEPTARRAREFAAAGQRAALGRPDTRMTSQEIASLRELQMTYQGIGSMEAAINRFLASSGGTLDINDGEGVLKNIRRQLQSGTTRAILTPEQRAQGLKDVERLLDELQKKNKDTEMLTELKKISTNTKGGGGLVGGGE